MGFDPSPASGLIFLVAPSPFLNLRSAYRPPWERATHPAASFGIQAQGLRRELHKSF